MVVVFLNMEKKPIHSVMRTAWTVPGFSTLITSAPKSPSIMVQYGPASTLERENIIRHIDKIFTFKPANADGQSHEIKRCYKI